MCKITIIFVVINKNTKIIRNILKNRKISDIIIIPLNLYKWKGITMRNSKLTKIISVILAATLMLALAFAVSAFADGDEPAGEARVTVVSKNVNFDARTSLVFALECDDLQENEEVYLLFWSASPDLTKSAEELYKTADYRKTAYETGVTVGEVENCMLVASNGIAASNINNDIFVLPLIKTIDDSGDAPAYTYAVAGDLLEYSVRDYAEEKLLDPDITGAQYDLCENIKKYGDAAANVFGN